MNEFFFNIRQQSEDTEKEFFYTDSANADFLDDNGYPRCSKSSNNILAKKFVNINGQYIYYVKVGYDGKLYDPTSVLSTNKNLTGLYAQKQNKYKIVNENTFNYYVNYLKTQKNVWINKAQREMI